MPMKKPLNFCTKCKTQYPDESYFYSNGPKPWQTAWCKQCTLQNCHDHYLKTREKRLAYVAEWQKNNADKVRRNSKKYRENNKEKRKETRDKNYQKRRLDPMFRLTQGVQSLVYQALKKKKDYRRVEDLIGYPIQRLKKHLEKQFQPGMSWENYGEWHVDHIIPRSAFNYETPEDIDFKKCWALKNLRPLWASENVSKQDKLDKPFQPSLAIVVSR